jgi:hypothetical protein
MLTINLPQLIIIQKYTTIYNIHTKTITRKTDYNTCVYILLSTKMQEKRIIEITMT